MKTPKLPDGGVFITFEDGKILYLPKTTINIVPNQRVIWRHYEGSHTGYKDEDIWETDQSTENPAQVVEGHQEYILLCRIDITKSRYFDLLCDKPFKVGLLIFRVESIDNNGFRAIGMKRV